MSAVTATRTALEVINHVQRQFGDESGVQVTNQDVYRWINLAQTEIFRRNEPVKKTGTANLVSGQSKYTFPEEIMQVEMMRVSGLPVKYMSFAEANEYIATNDPLNQATGQPQVWYEYGGSFMFWPVPDVNTVSGIDIFYIPSPVDVEADADILSVPDAYFNRLLEHVLVHAYEMDENFEAAQVKSAQFGEGMQTQALDQSTEPTTYPHITVRWDDL